ncbi:MAG: 1-acyl-sn-glycerol-3-phosphate acyltransferase [Planctomycetes bacterium]|nr:1-acyl-sn-glycerol-3-phosphate acyltransferase [Planctomycetota bacterium]
MISGKFDSKFAIDQLNFIWYGLNYSFYNCFYTFLFSLRKQGWRNVPRKGPVLLVANHQSFLDPIAVGLTACRELSYLARKSLFKKPFLDVYLRSVGCCPVDLEGVAKEGIRSTLELLSNGRAVLVFPEGTRSQDGLMQDLKPGIQLLIRKSNATVVPVGIAGAHEALSRDKILPTLCPIFMDGALGSIGVSIGSPIEGKLLNELPREDSLKLLKDAINNEIIYADQIRRKK